MKLPKLLCSGIVGSLMLMSAPPTLAQSQSSVSVVIAQIDDFCGSPFSSYSDTVNSSSEINTSWVPLTLAEVCTNGGKGFVLSVSSLRQGQLQIGNNTQYVIPYKVRSVCPASIRNVCSISGLVYSLATVDPKNGFREVFSTPGCKTNSVKPKGPCNNLFKDGAQIGIEIQLTPNSITYPGGTYTDTIYYNLVGN